MRAEKVSENDVKNTTANVFIFNQSWALFKLRVIKGILDKSEMKDDDNTFHIIKCALRYIRESSRGAGPTKARPNNL